MRYETIRTIKKKCLQFVRDTGWLHVMCVFRVKIFQINFVRVFSLNISGNYFLSSYSILFCQFYLLYCIIAYGVKRSRITHKALYKTKFHFYFSNNNWKCRNCNEMYRWLLNRFRCEKKERLLCWWYQGSEVSR